LKAHEKNLAKIYINDQGMIDTNVIVSGEALRSKVVERKREFLI